LAVWSRWSPLLTSRKGVPVSLRFGARDKTARIRCSQDRLKGSLKGSLKGKRTFKANIQRTDLPLPAARSHPVGQRLCGFVGHNLGEIWGHGQVVLFTSRVTTPSLPSSRVKIIDSGSLRCQRCKAEESPEGASPADSFLLLATIKHLVLIAGNFSPCPGRKHVDRSGGRRRSGDLALVVRDAAQSEANG
jgi:hypothetical protein